MPLLLLPLKQFVAFSGAIEMAEMTRRERVKAALAGSAVDRAPASFWGHDYLREWTPAGLAEATLERFRRYGWDFVKVNPRATYYAEAWGSRYRPSGDELHGPLNVDYVLKTTRDLDRLAPLDVHAGPFGEQLEALRLIGEGLAGEAPFVQTVFSPLSVVGRLANGDLGQVRRHMRENGEALHRALAAVAQTLATYAAACLETGADGIFFATVDWGTYDVATAEQYAEFGRPYDLQVLEAVAAAEFNILHVCRKHNMLESMLDYPVHAFNWANRDSGNASLADILAKSNRAVMGGVAVATVSAGTPEQVTAEVAEALAETGGKRFLLAAGCSIPPRTPEANLRAAPAALPVKAKQGRAPVAKPSAAPAALPVKAKRGRTPEAKPSAAPAAPPVKAKRGRTPEANLRAAPAALPVKAKRGRTKKS
jgi:uroporphyrinogen decarboxylase